MSNEDNKQQFDANEFINMHNAMATDGEGSAFAQKVIRNPITDRITHVNDNKDGDEMLEVSFRLEPVLHKLMSYRADPTGNTPIYVDQEYITIKIPGDLLTVNDRPVTEYDKFRFRKEYAAFAQGVGVSNGTPLNQLPGLTPAQVKELSHHGIQSIEQLSSVEETGVRIRNIHSFKMQAAQFLEHSKVVQAERKIDDKLSERDDEIAALKAQLEQVMKLVGATTASSAPEETVDEPTSTPSRKKYGSKS